MKKQKANEEGKNIFNENQIKLENLRTNYKQLKKRKRNMKIELNHKLLK